MRVEREFTEISPESFMGPAEARRHYGLYERPPLFTKGIDQELAEQGIAKIEMPVAPEDFQSLLHGYEVCINEFPILLNQTLHDVDERFGNEAGHIRKERKFSGDGMQIQDPKNLMHFSERARNRWNEQFAHGPKALQDFLADGYEIHNALIRIAKRQFLELEETHPNISAAYFPERTEGPSSLSFMRLLRYDSYAVHENLGQVAKPHYDIGGATIQAYADAPGFWGAKDGYRGERTHYDTEIDEAYFFIGAGHRKLYGKDARLKPLYHGVDRIIPAGVSIVPERHAVILFIDAPRIDYKVTPQDTLPYIPEEADY